MKTVIVGAGISGLSTAYALLEKQPDLELVILEASDRVGGKVWSDKTEDGFLCESGVNAFLDNKPKTLALSQELGLSPWDYLNRFRVCQAKELFRRTQGSVKSIAGQVGFKDPKYFSRVFRKLTDLSPSEYREQSKS